MQFLRRHFKAAIALAALLAGGTGVLLAQDQGGGGTASFDSSSNFEVTGIRVDASGDTAEEARAAGWRQAQRRAWRVLYARVNGSSPDAAPNLSDSSLDGVVSGIIVDEEWIGPERYVARLGVMFDRARVSQYLGVTGQVRRSPPLLVIPVQWLGGAPQSFEGRNEWQRAWLRFRTGGSPIDYVRASASGPTPMLLTVGQTGRPGRGWWRFLLDSYGAADVLIPVVHLRYAYPGGPVTGTFIAYYGPDRRKLAQFALRVRDSENLALLLDEGVRRLDRAYAAALRSGQLRPDPSLMFEFGIDDEEVEDELEEMADSLAQAGTQDSGGQVEVAGANEFTIQVVTPDADAVRANEAAVRGAPGVRSAVTSSLAIGGVSLMQIRFGGDLEALASALAARGFQVQRGEGTLRISRAAPAPAEGAGETDG